MNIIDIKNIVCIFLYGIETSLDSFFLVELYIKIYIFIPAIFFAGGLQARWEVTKATYPYMISICLVYFATLCIYPGVASEVVSCTLGSWMPILMMALFNASDLIGKMIASGAR